MSSPPGASTDAMTLAQLPMSGNQHRMPQVVKTRSNGPGASRGVWSTVPWMKVAVSPLSMERRRAHLIAAGEK